MADTILCPIGEDACNCNCNCQALLTDDRKVTVNSLAIDGQLYTFSYTITNTDPELSYVVFCIQCPTSKILISNSNTAINLIGNPNQLPVNFTRCFTSGCQISTPNSFYVEYDIDDCCRYQGIKIALNPSSSITEVAFELNFTLPNNLIFGFNSGNLKIKSGQVFDIVNDLCMPGCSNECNTKSNICKIWQREKNILESNKDVFIHFTQLLLPPTLDLNIITVEELENKIRSISKLEKSAANLTCNIAKVLENLNSLSTNSCYSQCTQCNK